MSKNPTRTFILIAIPVIIIALVVVVSMQPSSYEVARSTTIAASVERVFPYANDLKKWEVWNPWMAADPDITLTYSDSTSGAGASYSWAGNKHVGEGRATITESLPGESVTYDMEFLKPTASRSVIKFAFKPEGDLTAITTTITGEKDFVSKAACLFMSMDQMIGIKFETAFEALKAKVASPDK